MKTVTSTMFEEKTHESDEEDDNIACHIRGQLPEPVYREESTYFTIKLHYGGLLFAKLRDFVYEHGKVAYLDYVNPDYFNKFLLDNALKMLGYVERMRYLYNVEKRRFNEASFWLVRDSDFMNVVKLLGRKRIVELWCLPVVDVLELPWDDKVGHDISVVDVETGEVLQEVKENGELDVVGQVQQTACYAVKVYDEYIQGDNSYVVDEVESASESGEMEGATDVDWSEYIDELNVDWSEHIAVVPDVVLPADETLETDVVPPFFEDLGGHPGILGARRECACRKWQLSGIPCAHAISGMLSRNIGIYKYVDACYTKEAYIRTYNPVIQPMSSPDLWPELGRHPLNPPKKRKHVGRPKKMRKRSQVEPPAGTKIGRTGMKMTCRKCGGTGHNKRTCTTVQPADASSQPGSIADADSQSQPVKSQGKRKTCTSSQAETQAKNKGKEKRT